MKNKLLLCMISDTHGYHNNIKIPDADILLHMGDSTITGEIWEINNFLDWLNKLPHKHKIFINGNHERSVAKLGIMKNLVKDKNTYGNLYYLEESGITIKGINFWGSPYTPEFFYWGYMFDRKNGKEIWDKIPNNTDILMTHGPAAGYLDSVNPVGNYHRIHAGCEDLLEKIKNIKPKLFCFGHIHDSYGILRPANKSLNETLFINASICDDSYKTSHKPILIEIETETKEVKILN